VEWATTPAQRVHRTTLRELAGDPAGPGDPVGASAPEISSPAVIVIGAVAGLDLGPGATGAGTGSGPRPLAGLRVVVTRTAEQSRPLAEALRDQGARVVVVPVHRQADTADGGEALRRAAAGVAAFDWVAFTSANAVHRFVPRLRDARDLGRCRVAAVGPATAAALAGYHVAVDRQPADRGRPATAAGLAQAIGPAPATGGSVLFARAADARPDLAEGLRAGGWTVTDVEAYRLVPAPPPSAAARAEVAGADAIVFASPNTLTGWLSLADDRGIAMPVPPAVICVGPVTAETAGAAGLEVAVIADAPSVAGLVAALVAWRHGTAR
jgi:uroporphyrinogen III methyltransferase/synthase